MLEQISNGNGCGCIRIGELELGNIRLLNAPFGQLIWREKAFDHRRNKRERQQENEDKNINKHGKTLSVIAMVHVTR